MEYTYTIYHQEGQQLTLIPQKKHHKLPTRHQGPVLQDPCQTHPGVRRHSLGPTHSHQHRPTGSCTEASCLICERGLQDYFNDGRPRLAYTTASPLQRQASNGLQDHT